MNDNLGSIDSISNALVISPSVNEINFRFDASGEGEDDWVIDSLKVRGILVDKTAPRVVGYKAADGNYRNGQHISVSVEFNEILTEAPSTLVTSFGTLYSEGVTNTNVIVYSGTVNGSVGTKFRLTGFDSNGGGEACDIFGNHTIPICPITR